jgi:POT family proton-dependent oligopeptide transporter
MSMMGGRNRGAAGRPKFDKNAPRAKFSQLWPYLAEHRGALVVAVVLSLIGAAVSLAQPLLVGQVITAVQEGKELGLPVKKLDLKNILIIIGSIGIIFFMLNFKQIVGNDMDVISYFIYGAMVVMPIIILSDKSLTGIERKRIIVVFILAFFVIFFWGAFEQAGASLTLFADRQTNRSLFGWEMPASYFQSVNPLAVILLAPVFSMIWGFLYLRKLEPSSPKKMALGLGLVALGYLIIAIAVNGLGVSDKVSMWWLVALYIIHSMGELCLSPIGLSMVSKLAPLRLSSLMMGTWFLANAAANKFAGTLSALIPPTVDPASTEPVVYPSIFGIQITNLYEFFMLFIVMTAVAAGILFLLSAWLEKMIKEKHEDVPVDIDRV